VWLAWSVKESVYKFLKRHQSELVFSPTKITLQNIRPPKDHAYYNGKVSYAKHVLFFRSQVAENCINTIVAGEEAFYGVINGLKEVDAVNNEQLSALATVFLLESIQNSFSGDIRIEKSSVGYPVIIQNAVQLNVPVSLSHSGRFVAYVIQL
jgi:phosphopantetheinyl transferase